MDHSQAQTNSSEKLHIDLDRFRSLANEISKLTQKELKKSFDEKFEDDNGH